MVDGVLYVSTGVGQVAAVNALTGKQIWVHETGSKGGVNRGVAYWQKGNDRRIFHGNTDDYLTALMPNWQSHSDLRGQWQN